LRLQAACACGAALPQQGATAEAEQLLNHLLMTVNALAIGPGSTG